MKLLALGLGALLPVMIGPLPAAPGKTLKMHLCGGGAITIPVGGGTPAPDRDCHPKGCHAGTCRAKDEAKHPKRAN